MTAIATSSLVKHVSLGVGKVVAVEATALHVFFPRSEKRYAAKLRWPAAQALLTIDGVEPNSWLQGLTSFTFDASSGRYALAPNFLTHDDALAEFLQIYPAGFADPAYAGDGSGKRERAWSWRAANAEWSQALGGGEGERLIAESDVAELSRRALRVAAHVRRIAGVIDFDVLAEALEPGDVVKGYFEALFALLAAPTPTRARVEKAFATSEALGVAPDAAWAMATLFPFVADPKRFVLVVPKLASGAAARLGCDLKLKPAPNWATYAALQGLSAQLMEKLGPGGARDYVDVDCFLHALSTRRSAAASPRATAVPLASSAPTTVRTARTMSRRARESGSAPRRRR
jgi:hypothetical protein